MSKHILYFNPTAIHGGAEESLLQMMLIARDLGYEPVLVVPQPGWLTDRCREKEIPCELLPSLPNAFTTDDWLPQFKPWFLNAIAIAQIIRKWHPVIVHSNTPRTSYHSGLGARLMRVPTVTHVRDILHLPYASPLKARILSALADWTLVVSNAVEQVVIGYAPQLRSRIQTLYNCRDEIDYKDVKPIDLHSTFALPEHTLIIGNVSAMTPWKGQDILIEAFRLLYAEHPNLRLFIVGGSQGGKTQYSYESRLHQKVKDYGLGDAIIFTGWREDATAFIKSFDLFVHVPTQPDPLPSVLLQASLLGKAIVSSNCGGIPEIILDGIGGILVRPGDVTSLYNALKLMVQEPELRTTFGQQAHQRFTQCFSKDQMREGLAAAYQRCLS